MSQQTSEDQLFEQLVKGKITDQEYEKRKQYAGLVKGARVMVTEDHDGAKVKHKTGTIIVPYDGGSVGIKFDERIVNGGHNLSGLCEEGYGWYVEPRKIKLLEE